MHNDIEKSKPQLDARSFIADKEDQKTGSKNVIMETLTGGKDLIGAKQEKENNFSAFDSENKPTEAEKKSGNIVSTAIDSLLEENLNSIEERLKIIRRLKLDTENEKIEINNLYNEFLDLLHCTKTEVDEVQAKKVKKVFELFRVGMENKENTGSNEYEILKSASEEERGEYEKQEAVIGTKKNSWERLKDNIRETFREMSEVELNYEKVPALLDQLFADIGPVPERIKIDALIEEISPEDLELFCEKNNGLEAYKKIVSSELETEPVEKIISISRKDGEKLNEVYIKRILKDMGYNTNVLLSKKDECDFDAATNINGYVVPGWEKLMDFLRKFNTNLPVFFGKRFAPGKSRLHPRFFEGDRNWYAVAHIDRANWMVPNLKKVNNDHGRTGQGDYKTGNKCFVESLKKYFEKGDSQLVSNA